MSSKAKASRNTRISYEVNGNFVDIAEVKNVSLPALMRSTFDTTTHLQGIDSYVLGSLRRSKLSFGVNFIPHDSTHDHLTGMYRHLIRNIKTTFRVHVDRLTYTVKGRIQSIAPVAPMDGLLSAQISIRLSGAMVIGITTSRAFASGFAFGFE